MDWIFDDGDSDVAHPNDGIGLPALPSLGGYEGGYEGGYASTQFTSELTGVSLQFDYTPAPSQAVSILTLPPPGQMQTPPLPMEPRPVVSASPTSSVSTEASDGVPAFVKHMRLGLACEKREEPATYRTTQRLVSLPPPAMPHRSNSPMPISHLPSLIDASRAAIAARAAALADACLSGAPAPAEPAPLVGYLPTRPVQEAPPVLQPVMPPPPPRESSRKRKAETETPIESEHDPFMCATCGKRLSTRFSLKRHQKRHTGERPWACESCDKRFAEKSTLLRHMITHDPSRKVKYKRRKS